DWGLGRGAAEWLPTGVVPELRGGAEIAIRTTDRTRHPGGGRGPTGVTQRSGVACPWIPAFAGMTGLWGMPPERDLVTAYRCCARAAERHRHCHSHDLPIPSPRRRPGSIWR